MSDQWYYVARGQRVGPVPIDAVRHALAVGQLYPADLVWREGMPEWVPAISVPELSPPSGAMPIGYGVMSYAQPNVEYAGFWLRVVAAIIDSIITSVGGAIIGGIFGITAGGAGFAPKPHAFTGVTLLGYLVSIASGWLYYALMESSPTQATLGKMAIGLRVTDLAGNRVSFARATGRHFGKWISALILCIGFIMVAFTERKQGLHDIMAGTLVIKKPVS